MDQKTFYSSPQRVQIVKVEPGCKYFKVGQFGYALGSNDKGGCWLQDGGDSEPGQVAYIVSKTKHMAGGALWFSESALRFTARPKIVSNKRAIGNREACGRCGTDIEYWGKKNGWLDRGSGRECGPYQKTRNSDFTYPKHKKHNPKAKP